MRIKKKLILLVAFTVVSSVCGCSKKEVISKGNSAKENEKAELTQLKDVSSSLGTWSVYWDYSGNEKLLDNLDSLSYFEAYFVNGQIQLPEKAKEMIKSVQPENCTKYLSVVNDVEKNGNIEHKNTDILKTVFASDASMDQHIQELISLVEDNKLDGIELDYEKIRNDLELWNRYFTFINRLKEVAGKKDIRIRVVLEPNTPVEDLQFPDGVEYVVMCYNLYGYNEDMGPKADMDFLDDIYTRFHTLPSISYALANGGYVWENGSPKQIRISEAEELLKEHNIEAIRDSSGALTFTYENSTVWYSDEKTLELWAEELNSLNGDKVAIQYWRM